MVVPPVAMPVHLAALDVIVIAIGSRRTGLSQGRCREHDNSGSNDECSFHGRRSLNWAEWLSRSHA